MFNVHSKCTLSEIIRKIIHIHSIYNVISYITHRFMYNRKMCRIYTILLKNDPHQSVYNCVNLQVYNFVEFI